jgi:hypothetical protein
MDILDFDELKGHDDDTFGGPRTTTGDDGKLLRHFGLARYGFERFPPEIICCAEFTESLREGTELIDRQRDSQFGGTFRCFEKQWRNETFLITCQVRPMP